MAGRLTQSAGKLMFNTIYPGRGPGLHRSAGLETHRARGGGPRDDGYLNSRKNISRRTLESVISLCQDVVGLSQVRC